MAAKKAKTVKVAPVKMLAAALCAMVEKDFSIVKTLGTKPKNEKEVKPIALQAINLARDRSICFFCCDPAPVIKIPNIRKVDWASIPLHNCLNWYRTERRDFIPNWDTKEGALKLIRDVRSRKTPAGTPVYGGKCVDCHSPFVVFAGVIVETITVKHPGKPYNRAVRCKPCAADRKARMAAVIARHQSRSAIVKMIAQPPAALVSPTTVPPAPISKVEEAKAKIEALFDPKKAKKAQKEAKPKKAPLTFKPFKELLGANAGQESQKEQPKPNRAAPRVNVAPPKEAVGSPTEAATKGTSKSSLPS